MTPQVELRIPPDTQHVSLARHAVVVAARKAGMDDERTEDLKIAVSEAATNAILAHQRVASSDPVVLRFGPDGTSGFLVEIQDAGPGFEPLGPADTDIRDWTVEGGLGITILHGLADAVDFVRGTGMQVSLRFAMSMS